MNRAQYEFTHLWLAIGLAAAILLSQWPSWVRILGYQDLTHCEGSFHFTPLARERFQPHEFIEHIKPYSRLAMEQTSRLGMDVKAGRHQIFGAVGINPLLNRHLLVYLYQHELITVDSIPAAYHFKTPWQAEKLARLGIRYVADQTDTAGEWKTLTQASGFTLRENPLEACLFYFTNGKERQCLADDQIHYHDNGVRLDLSTRELEREIVATFLNQPGWRVRSNQGSKDFTEADDPIMHVTVTPDDRWLELVYEPFTARDFLFSIVISFLLMGAVGWLAVRNHSAHANCFYH